MSKRQIHKNDFSASIKHRRFEDPTIKERERAIGDVDSSASESLLEKPSSYTPFRLKRTNNDSRLPAITLASVGDEVVARRNEDAPPSATIQQHLHGISSTRDRFEQIATDSWSRREARGFSSPWSSSKEETEYLLGTAMGSATRPSTRLLGRGFLTTTTMMQPLSSFVAQAESMMDPTDLVGHNSPQHSSLSVLTSYYYNLLDASRKSLEEEFVLKRQLNMLQRNILLSPDDMAALSWARRPISLGLPLPSFQQDYGASGVIAPPSRNFIGSSKKAAPRLSTAADIPSEQPLRTTGPLLTTFKEKQAKLQAQLVANDYSRRRSHSFNPTLANNGMGNMHLVPRGHASRTALSDKVPPMQDHHKTSEHTNNVRGSLARLLPLPVTSGKKKCCHFSERICVSLATDEDPNWLSEYLCFVRSDIVEVFRASKDDVQSRNTTKKVNYGQVGIRCRFCAHMPSTSRTRRSSSFPFTLSRIYQSLTMMLRDHFGNCHYMPDPIKEKYLRLKGKTPQGASGSNQYWESSARKLGLKDSTLGIWVEESSDSQVTRNNYKTLHESNPSHIQTLGNDLTVSPVLAQEQAPLLIKPDDRTLVSDFLYELLTHAQLVHLDESEKIGNRKNLQVGIPGIGCRYCCQKNRKGLCRTFPARRRTLSHKLSDLYEHIRRCPLCPKKQREKLIVLKKYHEDSRIKTETTSKAGDTAFLDCLWERMTTATTYVPTDS